LVAVTASVQRDRAEGPEGEWAVGKAKSKEPAKHDGTGKHDRRWWWEPADFECGADVTKITAVIAGPYEECDVHWLEKHEDSAEVGDSGSRMGDPKKWPEPGPYAKVINAVREEWLQGFRERGMPNPLALLKGRHAPRDRELPEAPPLRLVGIGGVRSGAPSPPSRFVPVRQPGLMPIDDHEWEARWRYRWALDLLRPAERRAIDAYVVHGYDYDLFEVEDPHRRHLYKALDKLAKYYGRKDYMAEVERRLKQELVRMAVERWEFYSLSTAIRWRRPSAASTGRNWRKNWA
jgi:hypothetical protein